MSGQRALPRWLRLPFLHSLPPAVYTDRSSLQTNQPYLSASHSKCYRPSWPYAELNQYAWAFHAGDHRTGLSTQTFLTSAGGEGSPPLPAGKSPSNAALVAIGLLCHNHTSLAHGHQLLCTGPQCLLCRETSNRQPTSTYCCQGCLHGQDSAFPLIEHHEIALCPFLQLTKSVLTAAQPFGASVISPHFLSSVNLLREHFVPLSRSFIKILNITAQHC